MRFLIGQIVRMLCSGLIHGDLSEFNVLVGVEGPVIIDLPQAVNAAGNNNAYAMLERDVTNITETLGRFAPSCSKRAMRPRCGRYSSKASSSPTASSKEHSVADESVPDVREVIAAIDEAREEAERRQRGREESQAATGQ